MFLSELIVYFSCSGVCAGFWFCFFLMSHRNEIVDTLLAVIYDACHLSDA
jgi:hypothetical protein